MTFLVEAQGLSKRYGELTAVADATFNLRPGEITGFLGPNGAGKTTTLKMLTGLLPPDSGRALIAGHDIQNDPLQAKQMMAYIPDTPNLYGKLKAVEFLRFMAQLYRVPGEVAEARIKSYLDLFGLTDRAGDYLEGFSHGMQQKVAIAGGLVHAPSVIFLDEPTVGLDPRAARLIKDILVQQRDMGNAIMFSTHILEIAEAMCDRVIIINDGRVVADAPVHELTRLPGRDKSLEDVFLDLTGGSDIDEMVQELRYD